MTPAGDLTIDGDDEVSYPDSFPGGFMPRRRRIERQQADLIANSGNVFLDPVSDELYPDAGWELRSPNELQPKLLAFLNYLAKHSRSSLRTGTALWKAG